MSAAVRRRIYLAKVWLLAAAIRLALWALPFPWVRQLVRRWSSRRPSSAFRRSRPEELVWAVRYVVRYLPRASCLTQALTAQVLLARAGHEPRLRIGVTRGAPGHLYAHAWLENGGVVVIGDAELERFVPLPAVEER